MRIPAAITLVTMVAGCARIFGIESTDLVDAAAHDDAVVVTGSHHFYVIDHELVPTTNTMSRQYGLDLTGDGAIDNHIGDLLGTLSGMGLDIVGGTEYAIDHGQSLRLIDVQAESLTDTPLAGFDVVQGSDPSPAACSDAGDVTCRNHFGGSASFSELPGGTPLLGPIAAGVWTTTVPGAFAVDIGFDANVVLALPLHGTRIQISKISLQAIGETMFVDKPAAVIAGAVLPQDIKDQYPSLADGLQAIVNRDCTMPLNPPGCGCSTGSPGKSLLQLFDKAPTNCIITAEELKTNTLLENLLAPDVSIDNQQMLSLGVGFTAVSAIVRN